MGLAETVVDPVWARFGAVALSYGFASPALTRHVKGRIAPSLDQHAGVERNAKGARVCDRGGQACDFCVEGVSSLVVAAFLRETADFDRMYLYGPERPVHVSVGPASSRKVYAMVSGGRSLVPREVSRESLEGWASRW